MSEPSEARRVFGLILIVLGILWMALSGLCTAVGLFFTVPASFGQYGNASFMFLAIVPGGISIAIGWAVWLGGRALKRAGEKPRIKASDFE